MGMEWSPHLHFGVVAFEKGAFGSPSTKVAKFTFSLIPMIYLRHFATLRECDSRARVLN